MDELVKAPGTGETEAGDGALKDRNRCGPSGERKLEPGMASVTESEFDSEIEGDCRELRPSRPSLGCLLYGLGFAAILVRTLIVDLPRVDWSAATSQPLGFACATLLPYGLLSGAAAFCLFLWIRSWSSKGSITISDGRLRCPPLMLDGSRQGLVIRTSQIESVEAINDKHGRDIFLRLRNSGPIRLRPSAFGGQVPVIAFLRAALEDD